MLRVMFVDDEPRLLEGLRDLLRDRAEEWNMVFATGGQQALSALGQGTFDVVVSDMRMPGMDGVTLLRHVQQEHPGTVRIVLSGQADLDAVMRAVSVTHQYLTKPTSAVELRNVIERACDLRSRIADEGIRTLVGGLPRLPSSPRLYNELSGVLADEHAGAREITAVLGKDMGMCARVLQLANSASFAVRGSITSIETAVAYLGCNMMRSLALVAGVFGAWEEPMPEGFSPEALQGHSLQVCALAMHILGASERLSQECFLAAMLHDVGKLVLAAGLPQVAAETARRAREERLPLWRVETEVLGLTHADVGAYLLGLWGLTYNTVEAVAHHHAPAAVPQTGLDVLAAVHVADALVHELARLGGDTGDAEEPQADGYLEALGVAHCLEGWREVAKAQATERVEGGYPSLLRAAGGAHATVVAEAARGWQARVCAGPR